MIKTIMHYSAHDPVYHNTLGVGINTNSRLKIVILKSVLIWKRLGQGHVSIEVE